jgi:hypothetical protein
MGTVIFPDAPFKVFLTASAEERAGRRYNQLKEKGVSVSMDDLLREILPATPATPSVRWRPEAGRRCRAHRHHGHADRSGGQGAGIDPAALILASGLVSSRQTGAIPQYNRHRRASGGFPSTNRVGGASPRRRGRPCVQPSIFKHDRIFAELFEQSQANLAKLKPGAIVTGTVVEVRGDVVVINAGLKSEGIVPIEQFRNDAGEIDVGVGDQVKVALDSIENGFGETVLSREKAKRAMVWDELEEALEKNETITGRISGKVKGGFTVDIKDVRAFLPGSLVDVRPVRDPAYLEGKELEFKLIKLDRKRNNVVVSRRAVVESEHSEEREQLLDKLVEGACSRASSRTSPTTARSSTWAASTACCTSPTWRGSACATRPRSSTSATSWTSAC